MRAGAAFQPPDAPLVVAVGDNAQRRLIVERLDVEWVSAIHSTATIAKTVRLGVDNVILHGSVIQANARIGSHVLINTAASVDHDNVIGDFAHISPHATLCGHVTSEPEGLVLLEMHFGGKRVLDVLIGDPLPRIC